MEVSQAWRDAFPGACVGTLLIEPVRNPAQDARLDEALAALEGSLRQRFVGSDRVALLALPTLAAYQRYYRAFGQTYHVLRQVESVLLKGRALASPRGVLVSAMFAAEIESHLLTAGHDADAVVEPCVLDCSREGDRFVGIGGQEQAVRAGDMLIRDGRGIISSVLYGPDQRTRLQLSTTRVLFVTYAPEGIGRDQVRVHLERIADLVQVAVPEAQVRSLHVAP